MKNEDGQHFEELLFGIALLILIILIICHFIDKYKPMEEDPVLKDFYKIEEFDGKTYLVDQGIWGGWLEYEP